MNGIRLYKASAQSKHRKMVRTIIKQSWFSHFNLSKTTDGALTLKANNTQPYCIHQEKKMSGFIVDISIKKSCFSGIQCNIREEISILRFFSIFLDISLRTRKFWSFPNFSCCILHAISNTSMWMHASSCHMAVHHQIQKI